MTVSLLVVDGGCWRDPALYTLPSAAVARSYAHDALGVVIPEGETHGESGDVEVLILTPEPLFEDELSNGNSAVTKDGLRPGDGRQWCPVCKMYHRHVGERTDAGHTTRPCPLIPANDPRNYT